MKRFIAVLIIVLLCSSALAEDFDYSNFNVYAEVFGATGLEYPSTDIRENKQYTYHVFNSDGCQIVFLYEFEKPAAISISGSGESFLAYCCAALQIIDPKGDRLPSYGNLLMCYMLANGSGEKSNGYTSSGKLFEIDKKENGFSFLGGM